MRSEVGARSSPSESSENTPEHASGCNMALMVGDIRMFLQSKTLLQLKFSPFVLLEKLGRLTATQKKPQSEAFQ